MYLSPHLEINLLCLDSKLGAGPAGRGCHRRHPALVLLASDRAAAHPRPGDRDLRLPLRRQGADRQAAERCEDHHRRRSVERHPICRQYYPQAKLICNHNTSSIHRSVLPNQCVCALDAHLVHHALELLLVVAAASQVEDEVDAAQDEAHRADGDPEQPADDDRQQGCKSPEDGAAEVARPEDVVIDAADVLAVRGVENPGLLARFLVDLHPPSHPHQLPASDILHQPEVHCSREQHQREVQDFVLGKREETA